MLVYQADDTVNHFFNGVDSTFSHHKNGVSKLYRKYLPDLASQYYYAIGLSDLSPASYLHLSVTIRFFSSAL